jgi:hypothetical protein
MVWSNESRASAGIASASSFTSVIAEPDAQVSREGVLGDVPLFSILRADMVGDLEPMKAQLMKQNGLTEDGWNGYVAQLRESALQMRQQVVKFSSRGQLLEPPAGTSHNFPYEDPDYTVGMVRQMIALVANRGDTTAVAATNR